MAALGVGHWATHKVLVRVVLVSLHGALQPPAPGHTWPMLGKRSLVLSDLALFLVRQNLFCQMMGYWGLYSRVGDRS